MKQFDWVIGLGNTGGFDPARKGPVRLGRLLSNQHDLWSDAAMGMGDSGGPLFNLKGEVVGIHIQRGVGLDTNLHLESEFFLRNWEKLTKGEYVMKDLGLEEIGEKKVEIFRRPEKKLLEEEGQKLDQVLRPLFGKVKKSEVCLLSKEDQVIARGVVVSKEGEILSQGGAVEGNEVKVRFEGEVRVAEVVKRMPRYDLVLLKVEAEGWDFRPVIFVEDKMPLGRVVTSFGDGGQSRGLGSVGVQDRSLEKIGYFGSRTRAAKNGVLVSKVTADGPAEAAGVKDGDVIEKIDGKIADHLLIFFGVFRGKEKGEKVEIEVLRGEERLKLSVVLDERVRKDPFLRNPSMKPFLGKISKATSGYAMVVQHDVPILPQECGGGVFDLSGKCVGVNVSRASRSRTYAVPGRVVSRLLASE